MGVKESSEEVESHRYSPSQDSALKNGVWQASLLTRAIREVP